MSGWPAPGAGGGGLTTNDFELAAKIDSSA